MIKAKDSQGLFDYTCELGDGKFMNNQHIYINITSAKLKSLDLNICKCIKQYPFQNSDFYPAVNNEKSLLKLSTYLITDHIQSLTFFFRSGPANFTLTCKAKSGNVGTQRIPEEATLKCKSSRDVELKVSCHSCSSCHQ